MCMKFMHLLFKMSYQSYIHTLSKLETIDRDNLSVIYQDYKKNSNASYLIDLITSELLPILPITGSQIKPLSTTFLNMIVRHRLKVSSSPSEHGFITDDQGYVCGVMVDGVRYNLEIQHMIKCAALGFMFRGNVSSPFCV